LYTAAARGGFRSDALAMIADRVKAASLRSEAAGSPA
jgi:hypothetical protein